jgi:hypothetical protein
MHGDRFLGQLTVSGRGMVGRAGEAYSSGLDPSIGQAKSSDRGDQRKKICIYSKRYSIKIIYIDEQRDGGYL